MFESLLDNIADMIVGKGVINVFTRLAIGDQITLAQNLQLVRHGGFGHTKQICNVADAHRFAVYGKKYTDAGGVTKDLEEVREVVESILVGHLFPSFINNIAVYLLTFTGWSILFIKLQLYLPHFALRLNDCSTVYLIISSFYILVNSLVRKSKKNKHSSLLEKASPVWYNIEKS